MLRISTVIEVHYYFVCERVLSSEVELVYVPKDQQVANIFTKPLGLDKLQQFWSELGLQHLDMPTLRGTSTGRVECALQVWHDGL